MWRAANLFFHKRGLYSSVGTLERIFLYMCQGNSDLDGPDPYLLVLKLVLQKETVSSFHHIFEATKRVLEIVIVEA